MPLKKILTWQDPRKLLWGFHIHQELPLPDFSQALVIQKHCANFLKNNNIAINNDDAIKPGYGPHLEYMWELRIETEQEKILEKLGLIISFMAVNRHHLSAYIHPLMHDRALSEIEALAAEGRNNQANALWFGHKIAQYQDFFFNPPLDNQQVVDTRTSRILKPEEKDLLFRQGIKTIQQQPIDPSQVISNGFHIHMDYLPENESLALSIFDHFLIFLLGENLRPTSTRLYRPYENGPHVLGGWEVKFETQDQSILENIGIAIGWLMCNRHGLPVFIHPVTWQDGDFAEELKAHKEYSFFIGHLPTMDLTFFSDKIKTSESLV